MYLYLCRPTEFMDYKFQGLEESGEQFPTFDDLVGCIISDSQRKLISGPVL